MCYLPRQSLQSFLYGFGCTDKFRNVAFSQSLKSCWLEISIVQNWMKQDSVLVPFVFDFSWSQFFFVYLEEEIKGCREIVHHTEGRVFNLETLCCIRSESVALLQPCALPLIICCLYVYTEERRTDKCFVRMPSVSYGKLRSSLAWKAWGINSGQWKPESMDRFSCICNFTLCFNSSSDSYIMLELVNTAIKKLKHYP